MDQSKYSVHNRYTLLHATTRSYFGILDAADIWKKLIISEPSDVRMHIIVALEQEVGSE